jgi:hypothetical protein
MIVVCHEHPEIGLSHPQLEFLHATTPRPAPNATSRRDDKRAKVHCAIKRALEANPTHVMLLDADDCVSRHLAAFVAERPAANGWYLGRGYIHYDDRRRLQRVPWRFQRHCGSSHILSAELARNRHLRGHTRVRRIAASSGRPLARLPFAGAIYCVGHEENFRPWGPLLWPNNPAFRLARRALFGCELTDAHRREFGLYRLGEEPR